MRLICSLVFGCLLGLAVSAQETLRPEQLTPGMKGYGLSVFQGTKPERFEVEIVGVLKNSFPKQDMILIKMNGANLEKHKVIAGMSGSPIYIDGKLIGALAYGWTFENDPLAGVTPIHNMLAEIDRKAEPGAPVPVARSTSEAAPRPLLTPLALSGFSPRIIEQMAGEFASLGLLPVAGGGASGSGRHADAEFEPGGSIGVQLIRGDLDATAVGTVSYVDKKRGRILAFGHPFFQAGLIEAPASVAEVHVVMSSLQRSFKMASPLNEIGALVGDWQSCIVADTNVRAKMLPVTVRVANLGTGHRETYNMEVIENPVYTPRLVLSAVASVLEVASASSQETTLKMDLAATLADRTIRVTNTYYNSSGTLINPGAFLPLQQIFITPFGQPKVKRIEINVTATLARQTADIKRAYFDKSQVERGEKALLHVVLKPFGQPELTKIIPITVPAATDMMRELMIIVMGGNSAPPDVAAPDNLDDHLNAIEKRRAATELVALLPSAGQGLQYRGRLLKNLPPSALGVLGDDAGRDAIGAADMQQLAVPTDWVLSGTAFARVPIRQE